MSGDTTPAAAHAPTPSPPAPRSPVGSEARLLAVCTLLSGKGPWGPEFLHAACLAIEELEAWAVHGELPALPAPPPEAEPTTAVELLPQAVEANPFAARNPNSISLHAPLSPAGVARTPYPHPQGAPSVQPSVTASPGLPIANTTGK